MPLWKQHLVMASCGMLGGILCLPAMSICALQSFPRDEILFVGLLSGFFGACLAAVVANQWLTVNQDSLEDVLPVGLITFILLTVAGTFGLIFIAMYTGGFAGIIDRMD